MESFGDVFELVKSFCRNYPTISDIGFNKWINVLEPYKLENNVAYLYAENEFARKTVLDNYGDIIKEGFYNTLGFEVELNILIKDEEEKEDDEAIKRITDIYGDNSEADALTFENFVKGKSNELALAFSIAVADKYNKNKNVDSSSIFNPLFIYGDSGLGKTHLMKAIVHEIKKNNPNMNIIYTTGESFTNEIVKAIQNNSTIEFHEKYRNADILLVDDVQFIAGKEATQEEFFHTFNDIYNAGNQIVLTSDIAPSRMSRLEERIRSRFLKGVPVDIQSPDFETRMAIVKRKAELVGLQLSDPIARLIAEKIKTNIRHLEGTVNLIKAIAAYTNEQPTMAMTQRAIREMMVENQPAEITVDRVISDVAAMFKVSPEEIRSTNRRANVSLARKITIYVLKQVKNMTYQEIGDELGKNHSTMTLHYQDACNMLKENAQLKENVNEIINNLKEK
ncbi:chromosomal replication initiator protein DnaA [Ruminococcus sp. NK3A76]|uniref:chromosomal replication initiator protein DnaA n=1 Tax=Ruminococcus sp. NK3A76 TaxID=877411 RepID=UPI00048FBAAC|nr:chromosomal replication initiator protein DnaA [Ruminococcus sp. NK3A76]